MHFEKGGEWCSPQSAGRRRDIGCHFFQPAFDRTKGHGEKADHIGEDHGGDGARQHQPGRNIECVAHERIKRVVEAGQRNEHADAEHRSGNGIAHRRQPRDLVGDAAAGNAVGIGEKRCQQHGNERRQNRQHQRMPHGIEIGQRQDGLQPPHGEGQQHQPRHNKAENDRCETGCKSQPALPAAELDAGAVARALRWHDEGLALPRGTLYPNEAEHENQHHRGNLRGTAKISLGKPCGVDAERQGAHAEESGGTNIVQTFHQRK